VEENMEIPNGLIHWNVLFIRPMHDWEIDVVLRFFEFLYSQKTRYGGEDKICWDPSKRKIFEVKSYYQILFTLAQAFGPWKSISKVKAPPRVAFFVWTAALGKILTLDNLQKRNIMVMEWCYMCKQCGESTDHLFLHYEIATERMKCTKL
jgi:hypothetical protein